MIDEGLELLLVGINPGLISARRRAHFANPRNPFWRLLHESGLVPLRLEPGQQQRLLEFGLGITNLVVRASAGAAELDAADFERGRRVLARKIRRYRPRAIVFVGVSAYREFIQTRCAVACGEQPGRLENARVFVVPNPSGRNAHYRYSDMLRFFRAVARSLRVRDQPS